MARRTRRRTRRGRTSSRRQHVIAHTLSALFAVVGLAVIVIGAIAWSQEGPERLRVEANIAVNIRPSPWFDSGSTLFAAPVGGERAPQPPPRAWACEMTSERSRTELIRRPDRDVTGTRVVEGISVVPVVTIGPTKTTGELLCTGEAAQSTVAMWVMPTQPGVRRTPLSLVVGGIALLGLAAALHPSGRGLRPFGR